MSAQDDCIFCKVVAGEIPSSRVYDDEKVIGFKDLYPQARTHILFIHREHTCDMSELLNNDFEQLGELFLGIKKFLKENETIDRYGYRLVNNKGEKGGQSVFHTHIHLLSGEQLRGFGA